MGSRRGWRIALLLVTAWIPGVPAEARAGSERADSLFQAALEQVGRIPAEESLEAFRKVLKAEWNCPPAHHEMAKLYLSLRTLRGRIKAESAVKEALSLDPENAAYRLTLGEVLRAQGFLSNSGAQYVEVYKAHPDNARAAYEAGHFYLDEYLRYRDAQKYEGEDKDVRITGKSFAKGDGAKAASYLGRCIELDPRFQDAYYRLGVFYIESGQPGGLKRVANQLMKQYPSDKDALLFCGLAAQFQGAQQEAYGFYTEALGRMDPAERTMMESADFLTDKGEQGRTILAAPPVPGGDSIRAWRDQPEMARFWKARDPLLLTEFNERRMEHYSRVAYANLRFSNPLRGVVGWQTDAGKTWIKFGRYLFRATGFSGTGETWVYENFKIVLKGDGVGAWVFGGGGEIGPPPFMSGENSADYFRRVRGYSHLAEPTSREIFSQTPPRYVDPYREMKYSLPHQVAVFRDGDSVRVELSFAIPRRKLRVSAGGQATMESGVFAFDGDWKEVYRRRTGVVRLKLPSFEGGWATEADSLRRNSIVYQGRMYVRPGEHHLVAEVRDPGMGSIGTFREGRTFSFPDTALDMSDLLLASRIVSRTRSPVTWRDLEITPNPMRTYSRTEPVSVYFELYHLKQDGAGQTEYEIAYRVGRPEKKEVDPALFAAVDLPEAGGRAEMEVLNPGLAGFLGLADSASGEATYRVRYVLPDKRALTGERLERSPKGMETSVTARYRGDRRNDLTHLQIDVSQMPAGVYKLTVSVKDTRTGQTVVRETLFRVVG